MSSTIPVHVFELLISRLCHDIISPVGAIKSGLELLTEFGEDAAGETMALLTSSSEASAAKLRFFRIAYGMTRADVSFDEAAELAQALVAGPRTQVDWPGERRPSVATSAGGAVKLLLNIVLLAGEALPRGGVIAITAAADGPAVHIQVTATAAEARLLPDLRASIDGTASIEELSPRTVQGYYTASLAARLGGGLVTDEAEGAISFVADAAAAANA